jgi:membrane protease YdiL (CAAX protease family)
MGIYDNLVFDHIVFLLLAVVLPAMSLRRGEVKIEGFWTYKDKFTFYITNSLVLWFGCLIILLLWYFSNRSFSILGFQPADINSYSIAFTALFVFIYIFQVFRDFYSDAGSKSVLIKWKDRSNFMPLNFQEFLPYTFMCFTAGVAEEVIFRGFLMNYILALQFTGSYADVVLAILVPASIFAVIHMYQGLEAVLKIFLGSLLFGLIYYYSQSLVLVMIIHFAVDMITGYYLMRLFSTTMPEGDAGS